MSGIEALGARREEPMALHTSWRVGGPAEIFFEPADAAALERFLASLPAGLPVHFVGLGSNLLVRDGGVRGAVISTRRLERRVEHIDPLRVAAGAGLPCMRLARQCVRWKLGPAAFFAGIPGSVGGALAMNAGAFGGETWDNVERVETIDRRGVRHARSRGEFVVGYRSVARVRPAPSPSASGSAPEARATSQRAPADADSGGSMAGLGGEWFLGATFRFEHDDSLEMSAIKGMLEKRAASQPLGIASCGSVFRNPEGAHAGALIEQAGLKGLRLGAARVSEKHANFIVNDGGASAEDIERLIETVRRRVEAKFGLVLELEARVIGERRREPR